MSLQTYLPRRLPSDSSFCKELVLSAIVGIIEFMLIIDVCALIPGSFNYSRCQTQKRREDPKDLLLTNPTRQKSEAHHLPPLGVFQQHHHNRLLSLLATFTQFPAQVNALDRPRTKQSVNQSVLQLCQVSLSHPPCPPRSNLAFSCCLFLIGNSQSLNSNDTGINKEKMMMKLQLVAVLALAAMVAADRTASTAKGGRKLIRSVEKTEENVGNEENGIETNSRNLCGYGDVLPDHCLCPKV